VNKFGWFLAGGALGAVGALFLAPRSGQEARQYVAQHAGTIATDAQGIGSQAVNSIQGGFKQATEAGAQVVNNIKGGSAEQDKPEAQDKNEELRAKIEAARERIAAQVKANAEQTAQTVADAVETAGQEAEAATEATQEAPEA
jgi:gas vesicle protein